MTSLMGMGPKSISLNGARDPPNLPMAVLHALAITTSLIEPSWEIGFIFHTLFIASI
jgi:hypothetical protein